MRVKVLIVSDPAKDHLDKLAEVLREQGYIVEVGSYSKEPAYFTRINSVDLLPPTENKIGIKHFDQGK